MVSAVHAADWNYNSLGDDWGSVNELCATGKQQSPIDINTDNTQLAETLKILKGTYKNFEGLSGLYMLDKGYTIQANLPGGISGGNGGYKRIFWNGHSGQFESLQFHVHAPSEHTVNGYHFDLELHVVHLFADGTLGGVIGVFFDRKKGGETENFFVQEMISPDPTPSPGSRRDMHLGDFMAKLDTSKFWAYPGGLTTPPCTEGVVWNVMMEV